MSKVTTYKSDEFIVAEILSTVSDSINKPHTYIYSIYHRPDSLDGYRSFYDEHGNSKDFETRWEAEQFLEDNPVIKAAS